MVLSFKKRFEDKIWHGSKKHTIREDKHDRWKAGNKIHFSTGVRTSKQNCFKEGNCISTQIIRIFRVPFGLSFPAVFIDKRRIMGQELLMLAKNDGFDSVEEFFEWFDKDFTGKIIHWTDLRY